MNIPHPCEYQTYAAHPEYGPAEYCDEPAEPGRETCWRHDPEPDPDALRDQWIDEQMGI